MRSPLSQHTVCKVMKIHMLILVLLLTATGQGWARVVHVSTASAINKTWTAGDTLMFANGNYSNLSLTLKGTGSAAQPIVLRAATAGQVSLGGSSTIKLDGKYIEVNGICFAGTYTGNSHIVQFTSSSAHCRLTECAIDSYNTSTITQDLKWVSIKGQENRVDHCYFAGKRNMGTLLVVWLEDDIVPKHQIDHNYFGYRESNVDDDGKAINGQEIIRIGDSSTSMQQAQCVVEYNYLEACDGEIETVSNKSCGNIYSSNTFYACAGALTLRHGNGCTVDGNWFIGTAKDATGGVRIIGEDHVVTNNYFQDLTGNNYRAAICIIRGKPNSALNEYFQVKNAQVSGNTFVHCKEAICVNYHSFADCNLPALNTTVTNNTVYNDDAHKSNRVVTVAMSGGGLTWSANIYRAGKFSSYTPSSAEWVQNTQLPLPEPDTNRPSAQTTGPAWRNGNTPTEYIAARYAPAVRKVLRNGQWIIVVDDLQSGKQTHYTVLGRKL